MQHFKLENSIFDVTNRFLVAGDHKNKTFEIYFHL